MTTINVNIDDAGWTQLTNNVDFLVQNASNNAVYFALSDTEPTTLVSGIKINGGNGVDSSMVTGTVWGKALNGSANISVTE